jgi:hypothetical protein
MSDTDVATAELEAEQATAKLAELTARSLHEPLDRRPAAAEIIEQQHLAEFAARRVAVIEERAHRASAAQRLTDLAEIGEKIDTLAAEAEGPGAAIRAAMLTAIAATADDFRASCAAHDRAVRSLAIWAGTLNLVDIPGGPHPDNGNIKITGPPPDGGVAHNLTAVDTISQTADRALAEALAGKADTGLALVSPVRHRPAPRLDHVYEIIKSGERFERHGDPDGWLVQRLIAGTVTEVDPQ